MFDQGCDETTGTEAASDNAGGPAAPVASRYVGCATGDLAASLAQLAALERAVRAEQLTVIAELDGRDVWKADGQTGMGPWVAMTLATTGPGGREVARVARTLVDLPAIAQGFAQGGLSWDQLVPLCRLARPDTDQRWAAEGPGYTPAELGRLARRANPPTAKEATTAHEARGVSCRPDRKVSGLDVLTLRLPEAEMATVVAKVNDMADTDFEASQRTGDREGLTFTQRRADAFVALASAEVDAGADSEGATVVVHADLGALSRHPEILGWANRDRIIDDLAVLSDATPLAAETARRLACDCHLVWVFEGDDHTVGIGRRDRKVPRWLRRRLCRRDGGCCRFPGCDRTLGLHAHHMVHWADLGPTDTPNLVLLCPFHHHLVHEGGWNAVGDADAETVFASPDGSRTLTSRPAPLTPETRRRAQELKLLPSST